MSGHPRRRCGTAALGIALAAVACRDIQSPSAPACSAGTIDVPVGAVTTVAAAEAPCVRFQADGSIYIVVPQFSSDSGSLARIDYEIGTFATSPDAVERLVARERSGRSLSGARDPVSVGPFERLLRERGRMLAAPRPTRAMLSPDVARGGGPPSVGDTGVFWVCGDPACSSATFVRDTAIVRFLGTHIAIFQSVDAPALGWTASDFHDVGGFVDGELFQLAVSTFGAPSDVDANGLVSVLMTPKVNALSAFGCYYNPSGLIPGYFYAPDLVPSQPHSNGAEILYSIVPDSDADVSCGIGAGSVRDSVPVNFLHQMQHLISYNQHVIARGGASEEPWLDEGMSAIAQELGARRLEQRYPPPSGRTNPLQLFPDSAAMFINAESADSYVFLEDPPSNSVTIPANPISRADRGAAWLFLRWLGDLKDSTIFAKLEQTTLTGGANIAAQSGQTFASLFGDFAIAVYTDSLPGLPRATAPARDRYVSRNLRQIYHELNAAAPGKFPAEFPLPSSALPVSARTTSSMMVGTMELWRLTMPTSGNAMQLQFAALGGGNFPSSLGAQVTVFHCPSAAGCP